MGLFKIFSFILGLIENLVSPAYCYYCREFIEVRDIFCKNCLSKIKPILPYNFKASSNLTVQVYAISDYKDPLRSLIKSKHYSNYLASKNLARLVYEYTDIKSLDFDFLVPVPLHWTRYYYRGYNQAEVMAKELSRLTNKPVINLIKRKKQTKLQASLSKIEREFNLEFAFELIKNSEKYKNKKLLLVDDLMTTGSTIKESCLVLSKIKPKVIYACVACRVL